jgi:hypothetical protein
MGYASGTIACLLNEWHRHGHGRLFLVTDVLESAGILIQESVLGCI